MIRLNESVPITAEKELAIRSKKFHADAGGDLRGDRESTSVHNYIARANIDHYLEMLAKDDIASGNRALINKLLIEEENKLSHDLEQLEFAEGKAAACRDRVNHLRRLRDCFADGSTDRAQAERMLVNFEMTLVQVEVFCGALRKRVHACGL